MPTALPSLTHLETPVLLLEENRMQANIRRMQQQMDSLGVRFRPHAKTAKCLPVIQQQLAAGAQGITVSTLKEAEQFFAQGINDILYAVPISPGKFDHAGRLIRAGLQLTLLIESQEIACQLSAHGKAHALCYPVMIEVDSDGQRSGITADDPLLSAVAAALDSNGGCGARLVGVMTHAGASYSLSGDDALAAMAERERAACVFAAERLRQLGHACPVVSVGSTPTALSARDLTGVSEVRAGVYVFFDLVMAGVGVCTLDEIALSVLCTVIGHQRTRNWLITDAGWMAMSRDRGTQRQQHDWGYGRVCDLTGQPIDQLTFPEANQEHGMLHWQGDPAIDLTQRFPLGSMLRILPNHACATASQFADYQVLPATPGPLHCWPRFSGW